MLQKLNILKKEEAMKITEKKLDELRHLVAELGRATDSYVCAEFQFSYYEHSDTYEETISLYTSREGFLIKDLTEIEDLLKNIKTRISCCKAEKAEKEESNA